MKRLVLLLALAGAPAVLQAQAAPAVPDIVTRGLELYRTQGSAAALTEWTKTWDSSDSGAVAGLKQSLAGIDEAFGKYYGGEVVAQHRFGDHAGHVYLVLRYDLRPLYVRLEVYRKDQQWEIVNLTWNANPTRVLPQDVTGLQPEPPDQDQDQAQD